MAPRFLLHSEMGQQGGFTISGCKASMVQTRVLTEMGFENMAVSRWGSPQNHLQQIEACVFLKQQKHPSGGQSSSTANHQLKRWQLATSSQRQDLAAGRMIQLNRPGISTAASIQGVTESLFELDRLEHAQPCRKGDTGERVRNAIEHESNHARGRRRQLNGVNDAGGMGEISQPLKSAQIRQPPRLLSARGQAKPLEGFTTTLLHRCQQTARHCQDTPCAASSRSTQS